MEKVRLGDICVFQSGGTPSKSNSEYFNGDIPWITTVALNGDTIGQESAVDWITSKAIEKSSARIVPANSVMVGTRVGVGKVAINSISMSTSQDIISLLEIDESRWDKDFICKFIISKNAHLNSQARGATIKGIKIEILANLELPLISLSEQKKISFHLNKITDLINKRKQQLSKLDELIKARFVELFGDRYTNDKNWENKPLYECADFYNGKAHEQVVDENGEYILVTSRCIASDITDYRRTNALLFPLKTNDIAMVMSDVPNGRALAKCILIDENDKYTLNQRICCLRNYSFNPIFFYYLLNRHEYFLSFNDGNAQTNLRKDDLLACNIIKPPIELQNQFAAFVEQTDKSKLEVQKSLEKLELLKKALMQKYFG